MSTIVEQVREAVAAKKPLRVRGAGTWLSAGRPVADGAVLSLADHRGITEYVPGDLTLTARAGTPLSEIAAATAAHDQWLPLDPWGGDAGTIGATVSTATAGPHSFAMGLPRDVVLGLECVTGSGAVVRPGGRVVKNVAGFDLTRLLVGSWGTLGVITEVTVRLRARPKITKTFACLPRARLNIGDLGVAIRRLPFTPLASELVNENLARHLGLANRTTLLLRVGANAKGVEAQIDLLRELGPLTEMTEDVWPRLRAEPAGASSWRWSDLPSGFGAMWSTAFSAIQRDAGLLLHGNPARGIVRAVSPGRAAPRSNDIQTGHMSGTLAIERVPNEAWDSVNYAVAADPLSAAIRARFDPAGILNPGILGAAT